MRGIVAAAAAFCVLSVLFTVPVAWNLGSRVPTGDYTVDPLHVFYGFAWGTQSLLSHPLSYLDAGFFYPYPMALAFMDQLFGLCLLGLPVLALTGNAVAAYGVVWLITFVLCGLGAFQLVRRLTGSWPGGFLAGVLFAFYPFRYHNAGAIQVEAVMWIPFALLALHRWFDSGRRRHLILFFALSCLQFVCNGYTAVFLEIAAGLFLAVRLAGDRRSAGALLRRDRWVLVAAAAASALVLLPFAYPAWHNARLVGDAYRSLGASAVFSAKPLDFLTAAPNSILRCYLAHLGTGKHPLFPGIVALSLSAALVLGRGWRRTASAELPERPADGAGDVTTGAGTSATGSGDVATGSGDVATGAGKAARAARADVLFYVWLAAVSGVLALGPFFTMGGHRIPLPFALVHYAVPGASLIRAPARFAVLLSLAVAVLAGIALARTLAARKGLGKGVAAMLVIAAAGAELYGAPVRLIDPYPEGIPAVYETLRETPGPVVVAELPMPPDEPSERAEHVRYQLYALVHGKRLVNGVASSVPPITRRLREVMPSFPDDASVAMLRDVGVNRVLVHTDRYSQETVRAMREAVASRPDLRIVDATTAIWMIEVLPGGDGPG